MTSKEGDSWYVEYTCTDKNCLNGAGQVNFEGVCSTKDYIFGLPDRLKCTDCGKD